MPVSQWVGWSVSQSVRQQANMSISSSINQSVSKSFHQYRTDQSFNRSVSHSVSESITQSELFCVAVLCSPSKYELIISTKIQYSLWHFFYSLLLHPVLLNSVLNSRGHRVAEMLNALYIQFWRSQVQILNSSKVPSPTPHLPFVNNQLVGLLPFKTFSIYAIHLFTVSILAKEHLFYLIWGDPFVFLAMPFPGSFTLNTFSFYPNRLFYGLLSKVWRAPYHFYNLRFFLFSFFMKTSSFKMKSLMIQWRIQTLS